MKIDHIAIWTKDLETTKDFYVRYFNMICSKKYNNDLKRFSSYFLSFSNNDTRIELMQRPDIPEHKGRKGLINGLTHFSISVGSRESVNSLTERLRIDNYVIQSEPRITGDGYYESVVLDPEGNLIEITE